LSRNVLPFRTASRLVRVAAASLLVVACAPGETATPPTSATVSTKPVAAAVADAYPRTAAMFLGQDSLPTPEQLARYDVVVIDNEWANREPPSYFAELRRLNPRLKLLAYVNLVDAVHVTGTPGYWPNTYRLWRISPTDPTANTFPAQWLAHTASGTPVHEFEDRVMTNLTDAGPRIDGQLFVEYAVDWIVDTVWPAGIWDGIYLDVWSDRMWTADTDHWDVDGDGHDESDADIYGPDKPWGRGLLIGERRLRAALPNALVIGNGDRTLVDGLINGRAFESFTDTHVRGTENTDLADYLAESTSSAAHQPNLTLTINRSRAQPAHQYRKARFALAATLLSGGYWAPMGADYQTLAYYDEMDGAGLGRGYLGQPLGAAPPFDPAAGGVLRRDFEHGIVLLNDSPQPATVPLGGTFTKLKGTQDPVTNDGARVDTVVLPPMDALVLMR
jgi:hypothetical protein